MNEVANFQNGDMDVGCGNNKWNHPPYLPSMFQEINIRPNILVF